MQKKLHFTFEQIKNMINLILLEKIWKRVKYEEEEKKKLDDRDLEFTKME